MGGLSALGGIGVKSQFASNNTPIVLMAATSNMAARPIRRPKMIARNSRNSTSLSLKNWLTGSYLKNENGGVGAHGRAPLPADTKADADKVGTDTALYSGLNLNWLKRRNANPAPRDTQSEEEEAK